MIDSPVTLLLLGMSAVSALAFWAASRKRRHQPPADLTALTTPELHRLLASAPSDGSKHQEVQRRLVYLVYEELDRRHTTAERY